MKRLVALMLSLVLVLSVASVLAEKKTVLNVW
jgi:hypothetical protein